MSSPPPSPDPSIIPAAIRSPWPRRIGFAIGLLLLAGAVAMVARQRVVLDAALDAIAHPDPRWALALVGAVVANVVLSGVFLRILLVRYGHVGRLEMQAIVAATTLANFLPLRPGLFGRAAYHRTVNGIALTDTARTIVQSAVITALIAAWLAGAAVSAIALEISLWPGALLPVPVLAAVAASSRRARPWLVAALVRYAEVFLWALRYRAAFALVGADIGPEAALAFACVSVIATMVPFVSNGLGLREWATGLLAPVLAAAPLGLGVTAELVNRAAEMAVVLVLGVVGGAVLARREGTKARRHGGTE